MFTSMKASLSKEEEEIELIIQYWIRILNVKLGWINEFDKIVVNYAITFFMFDPFCSKSKLVKTYNGHKNWVNSIDYSIFGNDKFLCSGSDDKTICVWNVKNNKQIQSFNKHLKAVNCVTFSQYYYNNYNRNVICSSSYDNTIRFWNFKDNRQIQIINGYNNWISDIKFSSFNSGRYLCYGSDDSTIRLCDIETSKLLYVFYGHKNTIWCIDFSLLQNNESNSIGIIGGNGYTICSGSDDNMIYIWDIETTKQFNIFKGHTNYVRV
ncbi:WD-repeat protein [Reticulomyxa filosa]|uniref:WD-repeat protein n=1 Tax=Reticulomyxa filosa TaxID=46433 RepID=X6P4V4_RETFI|nr:WD-repeat protein [Reticulomyxa filosa]|eukprot:ETO33153.1 WD-repeat protein [Reticulomyxa filosa]